MLYIVCCIFRLTIVRNYTDFWVNCDPVILTAHDVPEMSTVRFMYGSTMLMMDGSTTAASPSSTSSEKGE